MSTFLVIAYFQTASFLRSRASMNTKSHGRISFKSMSNCIIRLMSALKFNADMPFSNIYTTLPDDRHSKIVSSSCVILSNFSWSLICQMFYCGIAELFHDQGVSNGTNSHENSLIILKSPKNVFNFHTGIAYAYKYIGYITLNLAAHSFPWIQFTQ